MQISDRDIIDWLLGIGAAVSALFTALYWYIWRSDRERISSLETRMANTVTKQEAEHLFERAEESYRAEHKQIITELRDLRGEIISIIKKPWRGEERRNK